MEPTNAAPPRGIMSVRQLLETEECPCKSGKTFAECCRGELKPGFTPETTLHMLFEEKDSADPTALSFYAIRTERMNGKTKPEEILAAIASRLHSPNIMRVLDRMTWNAANSKGLKMQLLPDGETRVEVVTDMKAAQSVIDAQAKLVK